MEKSVCSSQPNLSQCAKNLVLAFIQFFKCLSRSKEQSFADDFLSDTPSAPAPTISESAQTKTPLTDMQLRELSLKEAIEAIKDRIHTLGDWFFIERISFEEKLIVYRHINEHQAFIDKIKRWHIIIRKRKPLDANHLSKGNRLSDTSRFPDWKLKDGTPCPDKYKDLASDFLNNYRRIYLQKNTLQQC